MNMVIMMVVKVKVVMTTAVVGVVLVTMKKETGHALVPAKHT